MKTWIILGLITGMVAALSNQWSKHETTTPLYEKALDRELVQLHQMHPSWTIQQIANQYASEYSRSVSLRFLVTEVIVVVLFTILVARFGAHWWYLAIAFVLFLGVGIWIQTL